MKAIDFHAHIYPDKIASKAVEGIGKFYNIEMDKSGTCKELLEIGKECGIEQFVVHSVATTPAHVEKINDFINQQCESNIQFIGFGTMHQDYENKIDEAKRILSLGMKGIKIHPDTQGFNMDDEKMFELYDYMQGKLPLLIHCGDYRYDFSHPRRLVNLLRNFPKLTIIGAHFGGWSVPDLALEYLKNENCYLDTSSSIMYTGKVRAKELICKYGADRILFGSDFPMWSPKDELQTVLSLGLTEHEYDLILHENAKRILHLK